MACVTHYRIREYQHADLPSLAAIYTSSIRHLGAEYYSGDQIAAWSSFPEDTASFERWIAEATTFVAVNSHDECIGFGGIEDHGRIASLFVAPAFVRKGVGSGLLMRLLEEARARKIVVVTADASEFSRPLFEKFGLSVEAIEHIEFKGVEFSRYAMRTSI
jgi:putative acetyltransferase